MDNNFIDNINEIFSPKARLGIMTLLAQNKEVDFSTFKSVLALTDGNLGAHLKALEVAGYVTYEKIFVGRRPKTNYQLTKEGKAAFLKHMNQLEMIMNMLSGNQQQK